MSAPLSLNTQAILLLTAPLLAGRSKSTVKLLTAGEYKQLARYLWKNDQQPADLLAFNARELLRESQLPFESDRLERLLARGFLLSQAVEHWQTRAIWVMSRADSEYPVRLKRRLKEDAPPILYGCGETEILNTGKLAVVGSRQVNDSLVAFTEGIGRLAASAGHTIVSGAASGVDEAAIHGALEADGRAVGVLANSLERSALNRSHRNFLMHNQLTFVSPYDPAAGFNVGHSMNRNKLIYALSDRAIVVNSDFKRGGTWAGAVEQLEKLKFVPIYVRSSGILGKGLEELQRKGAMLWPNPDSPEELTELLAADVSHHVGAETQDELFSLDDEEIGKPNENPQSSLPLNDPIVSPTVESFAPPADNLFAVVRESLRYIRVPKTEAEVALELNVSKSQAKVWLRRLVQEGSLVKYTKPVRYGPTSQQSFIP